MRQSSFNSDLHSVRTRIRDPLTFQRSPKLLSNTIIDPLNRLPRMAL